VLYCLFKIGEMDWK